MADDNVPEDTTNYLADASPAVVRERQYEAWRKEQDRVLASVDGEITLKSEPTADDYAPAVAERNAEQEALEVKSFALQSVIASDAYDDFDDIMNKAKELYNWLSEGTSPEAPGGAQEGPEEPA